MQKSDDFKQNGNRDKKNASFKQFGKRLADNLRDKDERQVRERLKRFVDFVVLALTAYILGGAELFFGTYPLILAIMCSSRKELLAVGVGSLITALMGKIPAIYIYVAVVILLIRMLATLLPFVFAGLGMTLKVGKEMIPYTDKGVELHLDDDVFDESFKKSRSTEACQTIGDDEDNILSVCMGKMFDEPLYVRVLCGMLGGIICGFLIMLERDFSFFSLYSMLALILFVPLAVVTTSGILGDINWGGERFFSFSLLAVMVFCIIGAKGKSLLGIPMIPFLTMLFTLYFSSEYGILRGTIAGAAFGAVMDLTYSPMFMLSALLYSLISSVKKSAGIAAVCGVAVIWCYYLGGERGLIDVLPAVLFAIPIFVLTDKYREMMNAPYDQSTQAVGNLYFAQSVTEKTKNDAAKERLAALDLAFTSLSEIFYRLSDRFRRPDILGIRKISDGCFEKICEDCRNRQLCWGSEYAGTMEAIGCVNSALHICGNVGEEDLPEEFRQRCIRAKKLVEEVNKTVNNTTESIIKSGKFKIFSANYDEITAILNDALDSDSDEYECDTDLGEKIFDYLRSCELDVSGAVIYGKRCRHIVAKCSKYSVDISAEKVEKIRRELVNIVGVELSEPIFEVGKDGMLILFYSRPVISAYCSHGRISRNSCEWEEQTEDREYVDPFADNTENICGDITDAFITDTSYFYSLISDGMGSGSEAAYTSEVCAMFIQKMLMAGNRIDITLRMLNNVIRSENMGCGSECSATVDLFELDLMSGAASFVKSGAAPTYIARQGTVYKVSSRTMPVGIIKEADARITRFDTKKGDIIVMISDGCCHDSEDCPWLVEYLCAHMSKRKKTVELGGELCESLKEELLREALKNIPEGEERDDISVSVIVVG